MSFQLFLGIFILIVQVLIFLWLIVVMYDRVSSVWYGAPYVPMGRRKIKELLAMADVNADDALYDLGSGDGRVLITAVRDFGMRQVVGYEATFWPYWKSLFLIRVAGLRNIIVHRRNFFSADLSGATVVYAYLLTTTNDRLAEKLARELPAGARLILPRFPIDTARHSEFTLKKTKKIGNITAYVYQKI